MPAIFLLIIIYQLFFALPAYVKAHAKPYCEREFYEYPELLADCQENNSKE